MRRHHVIAAVGSLQCALLVACSEPQVVEVEREGTLAPSWEDYRDSALCDVGIA